MRTKVTWTLIVVVIFVCLLTGCNSAERRATYDGAMREAIVQLQDGDFDGASASLVTAQDNADHDHQQKKIENLEALVRGAQAYERGDRELAAVQWSKAEAPEIRRALAGHQRSLGIVVQNKGDSK
jgi:hypothetical protein